LYLDSNTNRFDTQSTTYDRSNLRTLCKDPCVTVSTSQGDNRGGRQPTSYQTDY